ncbi:MAG: hypothetical protein KC613_08120, partial [Myxococcales bacterium]|nr:hypothetical protein [Myxococcales bacterium]
HIRATDAALEVLAKLGYDPENGARPMARVIRDKIKKGLADDLLFGDLARGGDVVIRARDGELVFDISAATPATPAPEPSAPPTEPAVPQAPDLADGEDPDDD